MKYIVVFLISCSLPSIAQSKKETSKKAWIINAHLSERKEVLGIFYTSTDSSLLILGIYNPDTLHIPITSVYKLEIHKQNFVKRNTLVGALAGFGIGFIIGWNDYASPGVSTINQGGHALGGALIGGFIGAFAGHLSTISQSYVIGGNPLLYDRLRPQLARYQLEGSQ